VEQALTGMVGMMQERMAAQTASEKDKKPTAEGFKIHMAEQKLMIDAAVASGHVTDEAATAQLAAAAAAYTSKGR